MFGFGSFRRGNRGLRFWILHLLRRGPKNGAQIMDDIESMSQGWWRPSPGSIYPMLEDLLADGLIDKMADGKYQLTAQAAEEAGFPMFGGRTPRTVEEILSELRGYVAYLEDIRRTDPARLTAERGRIVELAGRISELGK
ncbi:MAG: PadR family transcriptional regulator [Thermoplasmata archaeon]|nr:PadR family transcriptional regulator [Thermoplasmata archaeon]